ncbi:MAG: HAMP domain-containing histidine kinase [Bacteroidaceae bacterium]|nr:HAMP domain-containing histidine kinase [Bacteroidaceae bacterium]
MGTTEYIIAGAVALLLTGYVAWRFYRHQCLLRDRAHLMREAVRNRDFTFRLPLKGLFFGERAMQKALNDLSKDINVLTAQKEIESWQKLTRVLTHEIMNAATPISSISQAYLADPNIKGTPYEEGIQAIQKTSESLSNFVRNFRTITLVQEPDMREVNLAGLCRSFRSLYPDLTWHTDIAPDTCIHADESMMMQVLSNLTKNAVEAGATDMDIRWNKALYVSNNGAPIPAEVRGEMFVPFFTTKRSGSGIGLSLSRQMTVMQGMKLSLAERPVPSYRTTFVIAP